jgi:predicted transcriptional regulator
MPNKLKAGTLRVSYVENQAINRAISILASVKGVTISALIREATEQYLTREDPKGAILRTAKELVAGQSESVDQRVTEPLSPESIAKLTALIKKVGSG